MWNINSAQQTQKNKNLQSDRIQSTHKIAISQLKQVQAQGRCIPNVAQKANMVWVSDDQLPELCEPDLDDLNAYHPGNSQISLAEQQEQFMNSIDEMDDYRQHVFNQESDEDIDDFTLPGVPIIGINNIGMFIVFPGESNIQN